MFYCISLIYDVADHENNRSYLINWYLYETINFGNQTLMGVRERDMHDVFDGQFYFIAANSA